MSTNDPVVTVICIAPATRLPMRSVDWVVAEASKGLVGDRYHGSRHRHVTLQSQQDLDAASAGLAHPVPPTRTRRNLTISRGPVPTAPGARLRVAEVELEVLRPAAPCRLLDDHIAAGAMTALRGRGGAVLRVLTSGTIAAGDRVCLVADGSR